MSRNNPKSKKAETPSEMKLYSVAGFLMLTHDDWP